MASVAKDLGGLGRPYTSNTFTLKLKRFESYIAELTQQDSEASAEERRQTLNENLRFDVFCEAIRSLFGPDIRSQDLKAIFRKISSNPDAKVDWSELFGYFQSEDEEPDQILSEDISVFTVSKKHRIGEAAGDKRRRDIISAVTHNPNVDIYISASQKGAISVWNSKSLRLQACCDLNETSWVTGVDYLPSLRRVIAATERSICIWDHRAKGKNQSIFCIKPVDNSVQCMTYVPYNTTIHEDCVMFGDDLGYVSLLRIAAKDLNTKHAKVDKPNGNLVIEPTTLTYSIQKRKFHDDWVLKVKYFHDLRCFASCSPSSTSSFVLESVDRLTDTIPCKSLSIPKGVNCFAFCSHASVIATGGNDKIIRIWHPHIFSRPTGKMIGHLFTIIDIAVNEKDQHVISLSTARVFRVWDIHTLTSLQVFTDNEERPGEKRIHCMVYDERHERLITGSSVLDLWPLTRTVQDTMQVPHTHDRPVAQVLFNQKLNQVVTVCTESIIKVWELESGKQVYHVTESHGPNVEVTAIAVDKTGYRLASGALDGSLKVWDFGSGQEIRSWSPAHDLERDDDIGITSLMYIEVNEKRCIVTCGWNNKLKLLEDSLDVGDLTLYAEFSDLFYPSVDSLSNPALSTSSRDSSPFSRTRPLPSIGHASAQITNIARKDNVLESHEVTCMTSIPPDSVATGCTNGNIIVWDVITATVQQIFRLYDMLPNGKNERSQKTAHPRRVNSLLLMIHRTRRPDPAYIKKLTGHVSPSVATPASDYRETNGQDSRVNSRQTVGSMSRTGTGMAPIMETVLEDTGQDSHEVPKKVRIESDEPKGEEMAHEEKLETHPSLEGSFHGNAEEDLQSVDPTAKMIVTTFDPILVSCHTDAFIRFWNMKGEMVREISAVTRRQGSPVTAVSSDEDCNVLITGDNKGYITMWSVGMFLENPQSDDNELIQQLISWRAHLSRIVTVIYISHMKSVVSGSMDGSVRMWYGDDPARGHFMGFFSQHRPWNFPSLERSNTPLLPYDINEGPLKPVRSINEKKNKTAQQSYEYPLVFSDNKWKPFRRSAYAQTRAKPTEPEDMKFFEALQKPQFYNDHLKSRKTGEMSLGAVFRALPVYTVSTPERLKTPAMEYSNSSWTTDSFLFAPPPPKPVKSGSPTKEIGKVRTQSKRKNSKDSSMAVPDSTSPIPSPRKN